MRAVDLAQSSVLLVDQKVTRLEKGKIMKEKTVTMRTAMRTEVTDTEDPRTEKNEEAEDPLAETEGKSETEAGAKAKTEAGREAGQEKERGAETDQGEGGDPKRGEEADLETKDEVGQKIGTEVVTEIAEEANPMNENQEKRFKK